MPANGREWLGRYKIVNKPMPGAKAEAAAILARQPARVLAGSCTAALRTASTTTRHIAIVVSRSGKTDTWFLQFLRGVEPRGPRRALG